MSSKWWRAGGRESMNLRSAWCTLGLAQVVERLLDRHEGLRSFSCTCIKKAGTVAHIGNPGTRKIDRRRSLEFAGQPVQADWWVEVNERPCLKGDQRRLWRWQSMMPLTLQHAQTCKHMHTKLTGGLSCIQWDDHDVTGVWFCFFFLTAIYWVQ